MQLQWTYRNGMIQNLGPVKTHPAARHVNKINSFGRGSHRDYKWGLPNFRSLTVTRVSFGVIENLIGIVNGKLSMVWYCWALGQIMHMIILYMLSIIYAFVVRSFCFGHFWEATALVSLAVTEGSDEQAIGAGLSATSGHEKLGAACAGQNSGRGRYWRRAVDEGVTQIWKTKKKGFLRLFIIRVSFCRLSWLLDHDHKLWRDWF